MSNNIAGKIIIFIGALSFFGCSSDVSIQAPDNSITKLCSQGRIQNTLVSCVTPMERIPNSTQSQRALIVYIEPGDYNSNLAIQDENVRLVANSIPSNFQGIKPYLRQIMINLVAEHVRGLVDRHGSKYNHIYFLRSDTYWHPQAFALAMKNILSLNSTVDMLLQMHGSPGKLSLNGDLQQSITVQDFANIENMLSARQRDRVRSIFLSACFSTNYGYYGNTWSSVTQSLVKLFPRALTYGSPGVNYGPLHRDLVNFENYYVRDWDFIGTTSWFANLVLDKTISSGYTQPRTKLDFPTFAVRGQLDFWFGTYSRWETVRMPALDYPAHVHWKTKPIGVYGSAAINNTIHMNLGDRYGETDWRSPSQYLNPSSCLRNGTFMAHGQSVTEYEYIGSGYDYTYNSYAFNCYDGAVSQINTTPQPSPQPEYSGGGY